MSSARPPASSTALVDPTHRSGTDLYGQPHQLAALATDFERYARFGRRLVGGAFFWMATGVLSGLLFGIEGTLLYAVLSLLGSPLAAGAAALKFAYNRQRLKALHPLPPAERRRRFEIYKRWRRGPGHPHTALFMPPEQSGAAYARHILEGVAHPLGGDSQDR